jgi:hypothetical protein
MSTHGCHKRINQRGAPMIAAITVVALLTLLVLLDTSGGCDGAR